MKIVMKTELKTTAGSSDLSIINEGISPLFLYKITINEVFNMTETTFNPITSLTINNEEVKAKATFMFDKTAKKFATEQEDNKGRKQTISGFTNVYNALLERDTVAIVDFWECATAYLGKSAPKREDIEAEIMEIIERENDTLNLLQGALDVMNNSGFSSRNHVYSGHR